MHWLIHQGTRKVPKVPIHIFTDSKYTYKVSTSAEVGKRNFYLIQEIQNFAYRIRSKHKTEICMHYVPSHIEQTSSGKRRTGNYYADILATQGRMASHPEGKSKYVHNVREAILNASIHLTEKIDKKLQMLREPDGPPANADDFSVAANADRDSLREGVP